MKSPLNGGMYLRATRAISPRAIWPMERKLVKDQLSGASPADDLFMWLSCAWAVAFVPLTLLSFVVEWMAEQTSADAVANNAGALMGIAITGVIWSLVRYAASAGAGRPGLIDDLVVPVGAAFSWMLLPG